MDFAKIVVGHFKDVVQRSSIRGFRDDFDGLDADVVLLAGETHLYRKPVSSCDILIGWIRYQTIDQGGLRSTEELSRKKFASTVVHSIISTQNIFALAEVVASRMRQLSEGRLWMGAHIRRGDCTYTGIHPPAEQS